MRVRAFWAAGALAAASASFAAAAQPAPGSELPPAGGETPQAQQPGTETQQPGTEVSDEKLRQFVTAAADVQKIQQEYAVKAQSLQKTTEDRIVSSVEEAGMTVDEFTALVARVQNDPALARRLDGLQSP